MKQSSEDSFIDKKRQKSSFVIAKNSKIISAKHIFICGELKINMYLRKKEKFN